LIRAAEADLENLRLTRPAGNNAYERFKRVLELEPGNTTAREGLIAITERYHRMVEQSLDSGDLDSAQRHLDSAHTVDPRAHWLTPTQSEIDQRRQVMTGSGQPLEPAPRADGADREACLSACERRHQACRADIDTETEANCLSKRAETCEQLYQDCMSDTSKMYMGQIALRSECAGVNSKCSKSAAQDCAAASRITEKHCQADLDACVSRCSSTE
jgi:hypothetical protein